MKKKKKNTRTSATLVKLFITDHKDFRCFVFIAVYIFIVLFFSDDCCFFLSG